MLSVVVMTYVFLFFFFFFSSRRRHTRYIGDWSSNVCSSDLEVVEMVLAGPVNRLLVAALRAAGLDALGLSGVDGGLLTARSEERRVGKEWRGRGGRGS